jgi:hypothetical protein
MPSRPAETALDALQPCVIADFWCRALDWRVVDQDAGGITIAAADRSWPMSDLLACLRPRRTRTVCLSTCAPTVCRPPGSSRGC